MAVIHIQIPEISTRAIGRDANLAPGLDPSLQVTVVYTTPKGTLAALKAAGALAKDLGARVGLIVTEVVPFRLPLDQPRVPVDFLKRGQEALVSEARIGEEEISVKICVCRDRNRTLSQLLPPRSLVVLGGRNRWWSGRERRLENYLSRLGHHVVFVDQAARNRTEMVPVL